MATDIPMHRYRISVPDDDEAAVAWFANQHNPSVSVRMLIKKHIEEFGVGDIFSSRADGSKKVVSLAESAPVSKNVETTVKETVVASDTNETESSNGVPIVSAADPLDMLPSIGKESAQNLTIANLNAMLDN